MIGYIVYILIVLLTAAGLWRMFEKAGKPGWAAIIPFYNLWVMMEIIGRPNVHMLWCLCPIANIVFALIWYIELSQSFGRSAGWGVLAFFFPFVAWPIIGFGEDKYIGPQRMNLPNMPNMQK